ncbi:glycosyltransferase [Candidatus Arthromitus sp. SFB-rat-Yit]|uniref:glycosyltransferase n=1 Tax=Candidatus Arthromitus sp. SFB-rat-Yit TaxID=1041504 RepID=UPI000227A17D|nr:glycosyltransferase [Candidatus Arthromitus sp. SFB-rat-Yit]BAK81341.1 hypothetical protein RATSFB_0779 [Candidatus Arthromitus sp. SFB-rat-Yit]
MSNILFVSCYSVDINNSASIELVYYMNLLASNKKVKIHLLTLDFPSNSIYYDSELSKFVNKDVVVHRVNGSFILNKMLPKKKISENETHKKSKRLIWIKNKIVIVDPYTSWINNACKYFKKYLSDINFDIIIGMHEPPSSLICAYKIKKIVKKYNKNVRLVSYFSDPYCNEISRRNRGIIPKIFNKIIENKIVNNSDRFLFVTENNMEYYREEYGLMPKSMEIIHRGFDKKLYADSKKNYPVEFEFDKINILYAGDIVKGVRNVNEFVKALKLIQKSSLGVFESLNVNFVGSINDVDQKELVNKSIIRLKSRVSYIEIINMIVNADILLVFGNKEFSQIPAKIYDYMGSNAIILVILEDYDDPLYKLSNKVDGVYCCLNKCEDITKIMVNILKNFNRGIEFNRDEFNSSMVLSRLSKFLNI